MPTFTNSAGITFVDFAAVPQTVVVSGFTSLVTKISVTFTGLTHTFTDDLDFLLVGPDGTHNLLFWSDAGGVFDVAGATFTVADSGAAPLDDTTQLVSGTIYQPADYGVSETDSDFGSVTGGINAAATAGTATFASAFNGIDPNGTWTLYARDDAINDHGTLASWAVNIFTADDLVIDGTGGSDTLVVTATAQNSGSYVLNGASAVAFSGITSLTFNGLGGDDTLTIVNPNNGLLAVPFDYDGGGQPGDALAILGGFGTSTTYTATGPSSGTIVHEATEAQRAHVSGVTGSFTLTFSGQTTASLAFNATAAQVESALNALSSIGGVGGSVTVTANSGPGAYDILFGGAFANTNVPQIIANGAGGTFVTIAQLLQGGTQATSFTGLAPVTDTVTEDTFTIVGTAGADTITITDGGIVDGAQTWLISSPTFESVRVSNKTALIIDGNGGGDTLSMDTTVTAAGLQNLHIRNVGSVTETGGFNVGSLTIDATNAIDLVNDNHVITFSAHVTASGGGVQFHNVSGFTVNGIVTNAGVVTLATDAFMTIGTTVANSGIDTGGFSAVRLQAGNFISQTANGAITTNFIGAFAGTVVTLANAINAASDIAIAANGSVEYRDADGVTISAIGASGVFTSAVTGVSSNNHDISLQTGGELKLQDAHVGPASIDAGTADVRIVAGGSVTQVNADDTIIADELGIIAGGAVTLAGAGNDVNKLAISTTGLVEFRDTSTLVVGSVAADGNIGFAGAAGITSGNGDVNLRAQNTLTLDNDINAGIGDIRLVSDTGSLTETTGRLVGDEIGIAALGGVAASLSNDANTLAIGSGGAVTFQDADDLTISFVPFGGNAGFGGTTGVIGSVVDITTSGALTLAGGAPVAANSGNVSLQAGDTAAAGDDLTVNTNGSVVAPAGNIGLRAGDNLNLLPGSFIVAGGFIQGTVDFGNADAGSGGTANLNGLITAPGAHQFLGVGDADTFFSAAGPDVFQGGAGNDRFVWDAGDGSDTIDGGGDNDTLAFNGDAGAEQFALAASGANAILTRDVDGIAITTTNLERLELAGGNGANTLTVADLSGTALTGLIAYTGGSGVDTINAAAAINPFRISTGAGNDFLNGGLGNDTAVFSGNLADYRIDFLGSDIRITDRRAGAPDGIDTLRQIENGEFANTTITFQSGTPGDDSFVASGSQAIAAGGGNDTITFNFRLVDATVTYAGNSVLIESGSTHTVASGFERFVFTDGTVENNDGSPLIDDLFYYSRAHDVWNAHIDADLHYNTVGFHEGRDPSAFFDTSLYLAAYPDVAVGGGNPLQHFDTIGWIEARVPSLTFDPRQYLLANPDVAAAHVDPLWHFLAVGASEGRVPFDAAKLIATNGFDFVFYLQHNPDVAAAGVDPLQHFLTTGWKEGRNPNALFDTAGYLAAYPDVAAAHINPLDHYNLIGWKEGRDPSVGFDTTSYLAANPDVAAAHVNPLMHFLYIGQDEGRSPFADGIFG